MYSLQRTSLKSRNGNYAPMLLALGQEQKFEVKFIDLEDKTADDEVQCLVHLSTLPVAVCYGFGTDQVKLEYRGMPNVRKQETTEIRTFERSVFERLGLKIFGSKLNVFGLAF